LAERDTGKLAGNNAREVHSGGGGGGVWESNSGTKKGRKKLTEKSKQRRRKRYNDQSFLGYTVKLELSNN